jgi:uncharacterized membrane protein YccC
MNNIVGKWFALSLILLIPPLTPIGLLSLALGITVLCVLTILMGLGYAWNGMNIPK